MLWRSLASCSVSVQLCLLVQPMPLYPGDILCLCLTSCCMWIDLVIPSAAHTHILLYIHSMPCNCKHYWLHYFGRRHNFRFFYFIVNKKKRYSLFIVYDSLFIVYDLGNWRAYNSCIKENKCTVLSLINAPGALKFFKTGMFIRGKFSMQKCSV